MSSNYKVGKTFFVRFDIPYFKFLSSGNSILSTIGEYRCDRILEDVLIEYSYLDDFDEKLNKRVWEIIKSKNMKISCDEAKRRISRDEKEKMREEALVRRDKLFPDKDVKVIIREAKRALKFWKVNIEESTIGISFREGLELGGDVVEHPKWGLICTQSMNADSIEKIGVFELTILPNTTLRENFHYLKPSVWHEAGHIADILYERVPSISPLNVPLWLDAVLNLCVDGRLKLFRKPFVADKSVRVSQFVELVIDKNPNADKKIIKKFAEKFWAKEANMFEILTFVKEQNLPFNVNVWELNDVDKK